MNGWLFMVGVVIGFWIVTKIQRMRESDLWTAYFSIISIFLVGAFLILIVVTLAQALS